MLFYRKRFSFISILFVLFFACRQTAPAFATNHLPGDLIVMLHKGEDVKTLISSLAVMDQSPTGLVVTQQLSKRLNIWLLHFDQDAVDEGRMLAAVRSNSAVAIAQYNHSIELRNVPNDEHFGEQWNMLNIGQTGGTTGADVRATSAWDLTIGGLTASGDTIVIAIDDDGFDLAHQDLNFWKNHHEIPGNLIDDDNNGYTDDYDGWNSQNSSGVITSLSSGHGTHVSGIAGAIGNNGIGVAGVNWNVKIMPVQGNSGMESVAVAGYAYILEMRASYNESGGATGAFVVATNSSWGTDFAKPADYPIWCAMYDSMGAQGILSAAATNNSSGVNVDVQGDMPTACSSDFLITVTNTDKNDNRTAAFGDTTIDLGAPGTAILSTIPGNQYGTKTGTSMSSPHLAGAVALICALPCVSLGNDLKNDPAATMLRIKDFILNGVDPLSSLEGITVSGGRLNVNNALLNAAAYYNCNVGIQALDPSSKELMVYPNPAVDQIQIFSKTGFYANTVIRIINTNGQLVLNELTGNSNRTQPLTISLNGFSKGIYLVQMIGENGLIDQQKIVVQ